MNLKQMTQTNVTHPGHKCRHIRRNPGLSLGNDPPGTGSSSKSGTASQKKGKSPATPSTEAKAATKAVTKAAPASGTAKVDKACPKAGDPNVTVCDRYNVKLNLTDIGGNNNKYYILQVSRPVARHSS